MLRPYRHQNLWNGCIGAWCPSQGHSGGTLIDYSPMMNHGTLVNMDPATDWVTNAGGWALDFDGSNDYVSAVRGLQYPFTMATWWRSNTTGSVAIFSVYASANEYVSLRAVVNIPAMSISDTATGLASTNGSSVTQGTWVHVALVAYSSTLRELYQNGLLVATATASKSPAITGATTYLGSLQGSSLFWNGNIDDARLYERTLTQAELRTLATRRGIAYERKPRSRALRAPSGGGAFTLTADAGTFSLSGQNAGLTVGRSVTAAQASFTLSGQNAGLLLNRSLVSSVGSFALSGQDAKFLRTFVVIGGVGSFSLSGQDAGLLATRTITADAGSFALSGQDAALSFGKTLIAGEGIYSLTGQDAGLLATRSLASDVGSFALGGQDAGLLATRTITAAQGSYALSGQNAALLKGFSTTFDVGTFNETGQNAGLLVTRTLPFDVGSFVLTGQDATLTKVSASAVQADVGTFVLSGQSVGLTATRTITADAGTFSVSGQNATLAKGRTLAADAGSFTYSGQASLLQRTVRMAIDAASFTITGQDAQLSFVGGGISPAPYYYQMLMGG